MVLPDGRARALFSDFYCAACQAYTNVGGGGVCVEHTVALIRSYRCYPCTGFALLHFLLSQRF